MDGHTKLDGIMSVASVNEGGHASNWTEKMDGQEVLKWTVLKNLDDRPLSLAVYFYRMMALLT